MVNSLPGGRWSPKRLRHWVAETRSLLQHFPEISESSIDDVRSLVASLAERLPSAHSSLPVSGNSTAPASTPVRIYTLGRFVIEIDSRDAESAHRLPKKPLELLKALIAHGGFAVAGERLCEDLWPDADGATAAQSLDVTLHRLRKFLGNHDAIECQNGHISLDPGYCWVDVWAFQHTVDALNDHGTVSASTLDQDVERLDKAFELYDGPFLPDEPGAWALPMRQRLHSKFVRGVCSHAQQYEHMGCRDIAVLVYERALEIDPQAEELYHRLMACNMALGRPGEALSVYRRCKQMLRHCLGIEPGPEIRELYASVEKELGHAYRPHPA